MEIEYGSPSKERIKTLLAKGKQNKQPKKNCGCTNKCPHTISNSVGELVVVITRETFFIQQPLPYPIWGQLYLQSQFQIPLQPYLSLMTGPPVTVSQAVNAAGNLVLTYTNGIETDIVTIAVPGIGLISYTEILSALKTNYLRSCFMTFDCNAANDALTFDNSIILGIQSLGLFLQAVGATGNKNAQLIIPKTRRQINNSVMNIIEIYLRNEPIKPETIWVHYLPWIDFAAIPAAVRPVEYNFTVYITDKEDMNAEKGI